MMANDVCNLQRWTSWMWRILYSTHGPYPYVQMPCHSAEGSLVCGRAEGSARLKAPACIARREHRGISPFPALTTLHPGTRLTEEAKGDELPREKEDECGNDQLDAHSASADDDTNESVPGG